VLFIRFNSTSQLSIIVPANVWLCFDECFIW
jgi:hypothetical protein